MTETADLYAVLGADPGATHRELHDAYRARAREVHPDHTGNDEPMKRLNRAWETLQDPWRRRRYDADRAQARAHAVPETAAPAGFPTPGPTSSGKVIDFGRYKGWSLPDVARIDRPFLEWLQRSQWGRFMYAEIDAVLRDIPA